MASAGVLYVWFLRELSIAVGSEKNSGMCRPEAWIARGALQGGRGEHADPQAAVGGEGLLRGEVVDVGLGDVDRQAARTGGGVHQDEGALVGARDALDRGRDTGRGLVVREGVDVDARLGPRLRVGARVGGDDGGVGQPGRELRGLGELGGELTEVQVLGLLARSDRASRCPRRRWSRRCRGSPRSPRGGRTASRTPSRTSPTRFLTGAWRWEVPRREVPVAASASSASVRTLEGPAPKRPSAGLMSAGIWMSATRRSVVPRWRGSRNRVRPMRRALRPCGPRPRTVTSRGRTGSPASPAARTGRSASRSACCAARRPGPPAPAPGTARRGRAARRPPPGGTAPRPGRRAGRGRRRCGGSGCGWRRTSPAVGPYCSSSRPSAPNEMIRPSPFGRTLSPTSMSSVAKRIRTCEVGVFQRSVSSITPSQPTSPLRTFLRCSGWVWSASTTLTIRLIVVSCPAAMISCSVLTISSSVRWSPSSEAAIRALVRSSPGFVSLVVDDLREEAPRSAIICGTSSGGVCVEKNFSNSSFSRGWSAASTPISSLITFMGRGYANSAFRSTGCPAGRAASFSRLAFVSASMPARSRSTLLT